MDTEEIIERILACGILIAVVSILGPIFSIAASGRAGSPNFTFATFMMLLKYWLIGGLVFWLVGAVVIFWRLKA